MSNRSHSELYYHFVWGTYIRKPLIVKQWEHRLYGYIIAKCRTRKYIPLAIGGADDHLHVLLRAQPEMVPADIAGNLKGASSYFINHECNVNADFSWQRGYGVFSVSPFYVSVIVEYIRNQKRHHYIGTLLPDYERIDTEDVSIETENELKIPECVIGL